MLVLRKHQKAARYSHYSPVLSEAPSVSLNVGPVLSLQMDQDQKVVCNADSYYPLDVEIVWYVQDKATSGQRVGAPLPKKLKNVLLSSHKHNTDKTYSLSSFFYLTASLKDEGKQFTCSVSHQSLRMPIKKSFILSVQGVLYYHGLPHRGSRGIYLTPTVIYALVCFLFLEPSSWFFILFCMFLIVLLLAVLYFTLPILHQGKCGHPLKIKPLKGCVNMT